MNNLIKQYVNAVYAGFMKYPWMVYNIAADFFGENNVDLHPSCSIFKNTIYEVLMDYSVGSLCSILHLQKNGQLVELYETGVRFLSNEAQTYLFSKICENTSSIDLLIQNPGFRARVGHPEMFIRFPEVTVTNEYNQSIHIKNLFVKFDVSAEGCMVGSFLMAKSSYTYAQYASGYVHSHVPPLDYGDVNKFQHACTGTGPINGTISLLNMKFDKEKWMLFCLELSKYVTVESLSGGPYLRLENVTDVRRSRFFDTTLALTPITMTYSGLLAKEYIQSFIEYVMDSGMMKFSYSDGSYSIGMSEYEYYIIISDLFIKWANENMSDSRDAIETGMLKECIISEHTIKLRNGNGENMEQNIVKDDGSLFMNFKGENILVKIEGRESEDDTKYSYILCQEIALRVLHIILHTLNGLKSNGTEYKTGKEIKYI